MFDFLAGILIPFSLVFLSELGDKTQLAILLLSSKTSKHKELFLGITLAFLVTAGLAVLVGRALILFISVNIVHAIAGLGFIVLGILTFLNHEEKEEKIEGKNVLISGFLFVLFAEMGDKSQIASSLLATSYHPLAVFLGAWLATVSFAGISVFAGKLFSKKINYSLLHKIAGILFILLGILFLFF